MSKRSKRSSYVSTFLNGARNGELPQPSKRRLVSSKAATDNKPQESYPIPLPFVNDTNYIFDGKPIHSKSEAINIGAENLFTVSSIPLPASPNKPSTSRAFFFPSLLGTPENISNVLTDTESASGSDTSEDELASDSSCQSTGAVGGDISTDGGGGGRSTSLKTKKKKMTRSEYYKERLNQIDRAQQDRRERWKKKLENMQTLLNIIKS
ncbi:uncharacterized protein LOC129950217 [Eupeodes corollae]|uniref:uncharacterized protein LOC129950217 n=1 Tax=Eupeodes corollae TaxID=290404 RepID=UPI002491CAAC|nr:uncharacterized protein LOC129950217 [Eupeodes corollae]